MSARAAIAIALALAGPVLAAPPEVQVEPATVVLGTDQKVVLQVRSPGRSARLRAVTQVGELTERQELSPDEARLVWTPPATRLPQTAVIVLWTQGAIEAPEIAVVRIPLIGRTDLEAKTEPGAEVRVEVAGKWFGPRNADARGRARVLVEVPPGARSARVLARSGKKETTLEAPLTAPPFNPLVAAISPQPLAAADGGWLWIVHADALDADQLEVAVQGGKARLSRTERDRALYELIAEPGATRLTVTGGLRGQDQARIQAATAITVPPPAPPPAPKPEPVQRLFPGAHVFAFYAGGASAGWGMTLDGSYRLPVLAERLSIELGIGFRTAGFSSQVAGLGGFESRVIATSADLSARGRVVEVGPWALDLHLGGGFLAFRHVATSSFQPTFTETGNHNEAFAAVQAAYRIQSFELFLELRGMSSPIETPRLAAQLGGMVVSFGGRFAKR